jgi:hypothetical protein
LRERNMHLDHHCSECGNELRLSIDLSHPADAKQGNCSVDVVPCETCTDAFAEQLAKEEDRIVELEDRIVELEHELSRLHGPVSLSPGVPGFEPSKED